MVDLGHAQRLHAIGQAAVEEAIARGASAVEAEHVLLAILRGADRERFVRALDRERERSLAAVGIRKLDAAKLHATPRRAKPGWGASVRELMKLDRPANGKRNADIELATGILSAQLGTVPRALAIADIDAEELLEEVRKLAS